MAQPIDRNTVDRLVVEHLPAAMRLALRLTGDADFAEEVVQEALCRVLRRWRSYRKQAAFKTWMLQIVINVYRDRQRGRCDTTPIDPSEVIARDPPPFEQLAAKEVRAEVDLAIDRLPERQREVVLLSLGEGLPARDIAVILEITEANVHTCLHLARKRIARAIGIEYARRDTP